MNDSFYAHLNPVEQFEVLKRAYLAQYWNMRKKTWSKLEKSSFENLSNCWKSIRAY